ncbi:PREDICTED: uncharacterized protein LOC105965257 [Erythranthe guttata]|uniref:uncharacterized protein LOC105965257 n=1 Tax=Erythranthe guttata TaxID=4155 RepID=UPI00064D75B5|nr:PREDICTED: uncharacterized protein LOC105965257 [Erythranthe guttata]|eukprot:XP_012845243.1 PREDICTED: uncharacterized protein LOC105965257 [Erythranthe guttata]
MADLLGRVGFEYNHHLYLDYGLCSDEHGYRLYAGTCNFIFEIRTNFILKKKKTTIIRPPQIHGEDEDEILDSDEDDDDDEILDSEKLGVCITNDEKESLPLAFFICYRLGDYWMTKEEILALDSDAVSFARQMKAAAHPQLTNQLVIPVVVGINVCTVQQEGETIEAARGRAIRSKHLVPVYLWELDCFRFNQCRPVRLMSFLRQLPRIRVVNVDDDEEDFVCSICSKRPWFGVQKTSLPCCGETFHSHCLVPWLEHNHLCPSCASPAYDPDYMHFL